MRIQSVHLAFKSNAQTGDRFIKMCVSSTKGMENLESQKDQSLDLLFADAVKTGDYQLVTDVKTALKTQIEQYGKETPEYRKARSFLISFYYRSNENSAFAKDETIQDMRKELFSTREMIDLKPYLAIYRMRTFMRNHLIEWIPGEHRPLDHSNAKVAARLLLNLYVEDIQTGATTLRSPLTMTEVLGNRKKHVQELLKDYFPFFELYRIDKTLAQKALTISVKPVNSVNVLQALLEAEKDDRLSEELYILKSNLVYLD